MPVQPYFMPQRSTTTPLFASFLNGFMQRRTATNMMFLQKYLEGADTKFLNEHINVLEENKREYIKQRELNKRESAKNRQKSVAKIVDYQAKTNKQNAEMRAASISRQQDLAERILAGRAFEITQGQGSSASAVADVDKELGKANPQNINNLTEKMLTNMRSTYERGKLQSAFIDAFAKDEGFNITVGNKDYYTAKVMLEVLGSRKGADLLDITKPGVLIAAAQEVGGIDESVLRTAIKNKDLVKVKKIFSDAADQIATGGARYTNVMEKRRQMAADLAEDLPGDENFAKAMKDFQGTSGKLKSLQEKTARTDKLIAEDMLRISKGQAPRLVDAVYSPGSGGIGPEDLRFTAKDDASYILGQKDLKTGLFETVGSISEETKLAQQLLGYNNKVLKRLKKGKNQKEKQIISNLKGHNRTLNKYIKGDKKVKEDLYLDEAFKDYYKNQDAIQSMTAGPKVLDKDATKTSLTELRTKNIESKRGIAPLQEAAARKAVRAEALKPVEKAPQLTPKEVRAIKYSGSISNRNLTQQIKDTQARINQLQGQRFRLVQEHQKRGREAGYFGPFKKNYLLDNPFVRIGDKERDLDRFLSSVSVRQTMPSTPTFSNKYGNLQMGKAYQITTKTGGTYTGGVTRSDKPFIEKISGGNVYRQEFKKSDAMYKDLENELKRFNKIMQARLK